MNLRRILGAVPFPAFVLAWGAVVAATTLEVDPVDADAVLPAPALPAPSEEAENLVAGLDDPVAWEAALTAHARTSELMDGQAEAVRRLLEERLDEGSVS